jgi:predicted phage-related endonuclease
MTIKEIFDIINGNHISSGKFSISSINGCPRKKYMEIKNLWKETYDAKTLRAFSLGDMFHRQAVKELMEKGDKLNYHVVAAEVDIPEHQYISGRADLILSDNNTKELIIVDIKSSGDWTLKEVKDGRVSESYINQMQLYLHFFKLNRGFIVFYGKHKGIIEEYEVIYNKDLCENLIKEIENFMINNVAAGVEPPKCKGEGMFPCQCCKDK